MLQNTPKHPILKGIVGAGLIISLFFVAACEDENTNATLPAEDASVSQSERISQTAPELEKEEIIFEVVEEQPKPKGGMEAFNKFIGENLQYPEEAKANGIEGRVFIQFVVEPDGSLSEVKTVKGAGSGLDEAALEAIKATTGLWEPGQQDGNAVRTRMVMPISFRL